MCSNLRGLDECKTVQARQMVARLAFVDDGPAIAPVSPIKELGAYEAMWLENGATFKRLAERFDSDPDARPSDFVPLRDAQHYGNMVLQQFKESGVRQFGVRIHHTGDYPRKLRDARNPVELLYFQGEWEVSEARCIAVVGSREATDYGVRRAARIARELVERDFVVVSGLAKGVDTAALRSAIEAGGRVIAVIGTPLGTSYPQENRDLQEEIAQRHLLISQVPVLRYASQSVRQNRLFFPERNVTMSALTEGTVIVEAGESSGTLIQARAAIHQGRKLFILDSCFLDPNLSWPKKFEDKGGVRVKGPEDIWDCLD